jgi:hypothetical protein
MRELSFKVLRTCRQRAQFYHQAAELVTARDSRDPLGPANLRSPVLDPKRISNRQTKTIRNRRNSKKTIITTHF